MAKIIRAFMAAVWVLITALLVYILYAVLQTEPDPQIVRGWILMVAIAFISITFLAYSALLHNNAVRPDNEEEEEEEGEEEEEEE